MLPAYTTSRGGCAFRTGAILAGAPLFSVETQNAASPHTPVFIRRIRFECTDGTAAHLSLWNIAANHNQGTTLVPAVSFNTDLACQVDVATAWAANPTPGALGIYKRDVLPGSIGASVDWQFDEDASLFLPIRDDTGAASYGGVVVINEGAVATGAIDVILELEAFVP